MIHFWKHLLHGFLWLTASEFLCLILAVSLAILHDHPFIRVIALLFGIAAHILLIGSCAQKAAGEDAAAYRTAGIRTKPYKPLLIGIILTIPAYFTYLLLAVNQESILMLNLFPLLNAPFIRIYKFLIADTEPFAAIDTSRKVQMLLPPVITALSYFIGYLSRYLPAAAAADARSNRT